MLGCRNTISDLKVTKTDWSLLPQGRCLTLTILVLSDYDMEFTVLKLSLV